MHARSLEQAWQAVRGAGHSAWHGGDAERALANAVPFMQAFGHMLIAWVWLDLARASLPATPSAARTGRLAAADYFFAYELPLIQAWLAVVAAQDMTCARLPDEAF
jgi:butyryl-CoA dehydrogenase